MGSEVLLYGYGIVCLSMLVYNIAYNIIMRSSDSRLERKIKRLSDKISVQLERIRNGQSIEPEHMRYFRNKLSKISYLIAFDHILDQMKEHLSDPAVAEYIQKMQRVILQLALEYRDRESMQSAYFAYLVSKHNAREHLAVDTVMENILVDYMKKESIYCRVNALQALCDIGSPESILKALILLDRREGVLHEKIVTDILLSYAGYHDELIGVLWERFEGMSPKTQLPILNYIRFQSGDYLGEMYEIMVNEERDKELRLSAVRYFGKYYYAPAREKLLQFLADKQPLMWEYAATAATALASYEGEDVVEALMDAVHSTNWYIRYNAAESLQAHHLDYSDLLAVVGGSDRYAREMVMYRLNAQRIKEEMEEAL